jgi:hypothetical protein
MKFRFLLLLLVTSLGAAAQAPGLINYQGLLRNSSGVPLANRTLALRFELRSGSPTGNIIFSEQQTGLSTGPLGLFNTQIGKVNSAVFNQLNWEAGTIYLTVGVDTSGIGSFTELGSQQLVSVPYALHSRSVPSSLNNNTLTIGDSSYVLASVKAVSLTAGNSNILVSGSYPDYTITPTPSLSLLGNELSISNGNTVTIAPPLVMNGYTLSVGPASNTVVIPSAGSPNITGLNAATVVPAPGNNFTVDVATPTITGTGATSVSGTYPQFTVNTPSVTVAATGAISIQGNYPNYVVHTPTPAITGAGASTVTGQFPNYTINTPTPVIIGAGASTVSGNYPNYTVNSFTPNIQGTGAATVTGNFPNYTVNSFTPVIVGTGASTVSGNFPNYTVNSFTPVIVGTGASTVSGNFPNYTVNSFTPVIVGTGASTVTGNFPNYSVNTSTPNIIGQGASNVTGIYPNYTVNTTVPTVTATGLAQTSVTGNTLTINVPTLAYTGTTGILSSGTNTVLVAPTLTYVNNILRSGPSTNTVFITQSPWTQTVSNILSDPTATAVGIGTSTPGINPGSHRYLTLSSTGTYTDSYAALELQGASLNSNIPFGKIDFNSVGASSFNSARISAYRSGLTTESRLGFSTSDGTTLTERILIDENGNVGIGTSNPVRNLQVQSTGSTQVAVVSNSNAAGSLSFGQPGNHFLGSIRYDNTTNVMSFGTNSAPNRLVINNVGQVGIGTALPAARLHLEAANGRFRFVNFTPAANTILLGEFEGNGALGPQLRFLMNGGGPFVDIGQNTSGDFVIESNDSPKIVVQNSGNVGIGTSSPSETLHLVGTAKITGSVTISSSLTVVDGNQADGKVFVSNASGMGRWEASPAPLSFGGLNSAATNISTTPTILGTGTMTFTKVHASTQVEIFLHSRANSGNPILFLPFSWVEFEIYVDGNTSTHSTRHVIFGQNVTEYITLNSIFTGLSAGSHTITIRANTDNNFSNGVVLDPGGFGARVIVRERF